MNILGFSTEKQSDCATLAALVFSAATAIGVSVLTRRIPPNSFNYAVIKHNFGQKSLSNNILNFSKILRASRERFEKLIKGATEKKNEYLELFTETKKAISNLNIEISKKDPINDNKIILYLNTLKSSALIRTKYLAAQIASLEKRLSELNQDLIIAVRSENRAVRFEKKSKK